MIQELQQIFHSVMKSLEVIYVLEEAKPCARILVFEDELGKVSDFLHKNRLNFSVSDFKVAKQALQSDFYSDKSIKIPANDARKGHFFVYLSKSREIAENAKIAEIKNEHMELGLALGYPRCCCEFFEKNFRDDNADLTLDALRNSNGCEFPFYTNITARHFDVALLSHFPHSFECRPSIEMAKNNLGIIHRHSRQVAEMFSEVLKSAAVYTMDEGIFLLRRYEKKNDELVYSNVVSTTKSKLYFLLNSNNKLKVIGRNNFFVNGIKIQGEKFGIMVFT